jgi:hypothetical protein
MLRSKKTVGGNPHNLYYLDLDLARHFTHLPREMRQHFLIEAFRAVHEEECLNKSIRNGIFVGIPIGLSTYFLPLKKLLGSHYDTAKDYFIDNHYTGMQKYLKLHPTLSSLLPDHPERIDFTLALTAGGASALIAGAVTCLISYVIISQRQEKTIGPILERQLMTSGGLKMGAPELRKKAPRIRMLFEKQARPVNKQRMRQNRADPR